MYCKKIRVVLVDDNTEFIFILTQVISREDDMEVVGTAVNGIDAIKIIKEVSPDVVLMDVVMPQLDGLGVLEKLVGMKKRPLFIMLSAIGLPNITNIAVSLGAAYFVIKPFDPEVLVSRIRQLQVYKDQLLAKTKVYAMTSDEAQVKIVQLFEAIGIPPKLNGYHYLVDAVLLVLGDFSVINSITKIIYPTIAMKNKTTASRVERSIRNAIEVAWTRGKVENITELFKDHFNQDKGRPSNSEFIAIVVSKLYDHDHFLLQQLTHVSSGEMKWR